MRLLRRSGLTLSFLAGLLGGCLPVAPSPTQILDPKLLLVEQIVVASGPYSAPLSSMPPGLRRGAALPGDRVRLRPVAVGPDGPLELDDVIMIRRFGPGLPAGTLPTCADDGLDLPVSCRVAGEELVLPLAGIGEKRLDLPDLLVIVSEPGGPRAAECLERWRGVEREELFGCLIIDPTTTPRRGLRLFVRREEAALYRTTVVSQKPPVRSLGGERGGRGSGALVEARGRADDVLG